MTNFEAFSSGNGRDQQQSERVFFNGMPLYIRILYHSTKKFFFDVCVDGDENDFAWRYEVTYKLVVVTTKKGNGYLEKQAGPDVKKEHNAVKLCQRTRFAISEVMDPQNGAYDEKEDAVTFRVEVRRGKNPTRTREICPNDPLLVNGHDVYVNKYILAAQSKYFKDYFFGVNAEQIPNIERNEIDVENFERLISVINSPDAIVDDYCVENIFLLASRFALDSVENRCVNFLMNKSEKSILFKFRLAHQCGISGMKTKIRTNIAKDEIAGKDLLDNLLAYVQIDTAIVTELVQMDSEIVQELIQHLEKHHHG